MLYIEINDYELTVRRDSGEVLTCEPAAAARHGRELLFGQAAVARSRSHPQQFNNRYLSNLAPEPISGDLKPAKNYADLIYHHLTALQLPDEPAVLAVSGHVSNAQLGLLLGICQEAKCQISGFIDLSLVNALAVGESEDFYVLDVEQHRLVIAHIAVVDKAYVVKATTPYDGHGASGILNGWMNVLADEFVQRTRFDPLHAGGTEQQLFDQVAAWLQPGVQISQRLVIEQSDASRDIEVNLALLTDKLRQRLEVLDLTRVQTLYLTPRAARVPALQLLLGERVDKVAAVDADSLLENYRVLSEGLSADNVRRVVQAPYRAEISQPQAAREQVDAPVTHLLDQKFRATSLAADVFEPHIITTDAGFLLRRHDGRSNQPLMLGDVIDIDGVSYTAISME